MSSFMVSDECVQRILALAANVTAPQVDCYATSRGLQPDERNKLANSLVKLNDRAVRTRYPHHTHRKIRARYDWRVPYGCSLPAAIKSLDCWLYQCAESDSIMRSKLYRQMERLRDQACHAYVQRTPEYEQAAWD